MKAKIQSRIKRHHEGGSALLVSLMIMTVTTLGVAAWVSIVNARMTYTEATQDAMLRRVALANSRELAEEYLYRYAATASSGSAVTFTNTAANSSQPDITERVAIPAWSDPPLDSNYLPGRSNRFSLSNGGGYYKKFSIGLGKGANQITRDFEMRSRSPIFSGDLVILNRPTITPDNNIRFRGNVDVGGRTVLWRQDMLATYSNNRYTSDSYALMSEKYGSYTMVNSAGDVIRPSNFPFTATSTGAISANDLGYDGRASTVINTYNTVNSLYSQLGSNPTVAKGTVSSSSPGVSSNGSGTVTIDLSEPTLKRVSIKNDTSRVIINGQSSDTDFDNADLLQPVVIVIEQDGTTDRNLADIRLYQRNNRRLIIGVKKTIDGQSSNWLRLQMRFMNTNSSPYPTWRLVTIAENTEIAFEHNSNNSEVTIFGGIRTDQGFYPSNGLNKKFNIRPEANPLGLDGLLDRNVWIENYPGT